MSLLTVLLVDDEVGFVDTMVKRLRKKGLTVFAAYSGPEALERLEQHPEIGVVVLDVKMPKMNGIEALNRIKQRHPLVEVIMLSGNATVDIAIEGIQRGAFDFMLKPCELNDLISKVTDAAMQKQRQEKKIEAARKHQQIFSALKESEHG